MHNYCGYSTCSHYERSGGTLRGMGVSLAAIGVDERADGEAAKNGKARSSMESQKVGCRRSGEENYKRVS